MSQIDHAIHIKTVFCDIDGCVLKHHGDLTAILNNDHKILPGVKDAFMQWGHKGYTVLLTTGRPESMRDLTIKQILSAGLFYHHLIMDLPRGQRIVINDIKEQGDEAAGCINLERNRGMENVDI